VAFFLWLCDYAVVKVVEASSKLALLVAKMNIDSVHEVHRRQPSSAVRRGWPKAITETSGTEFGPSLHLFAELKFLVAYCDNISIL
jgi:hypothetical protein